ncbi:MAG: radical SAM protein [Planctomycetota bacterium]|jgi:putative pyruvate formate lyase activating enzyme
MIDLPTDHEERIAKAYESMAPCRLCPRLCESDRRTGETGICDTAWLPAVSSVTPHFGEEDPLVGQGGSGTVFMTGCNLRCVFCQNHDISTGGSGREVQVKDLATMILGLQHRGCHNVNFVTPTHQSPPIMKALALARNEGLELPVVYNCGGYECLETLNLLDGFVQIYMPDVKFLDSESASRYCSAPDYPEVMKAAVSEMHAQVGDLVVKGGIATSGLLVRHLVMPGAVDQGLELMDFLAREVSSNTYVNVMAQYRPMHKAHSFPEIARTPSFEEVLTVRQHVKNLGLRLAR